MSHLPAAAAFGEFADVGPVGRRYQSVATRPAPQYHRAAAWCTAANVGSATFATDL